MVTKRDLGVGYLIGLGLGVVSVLAGRVLLVPTSTLEALATTFIGFLLAASFVFVGYQLLRSNLADDNVWRVAQWGVIGLIVPTLLFGSLATVVTFRASIVPGLFLLTFLAGGSTGVLIGAVFELRHENAVTHQLNQRNVVLYRILRHNLRNWLNVIIGRTEALDESLDVDVRPHTSRIRSAADHLVTLSDDARRSEQLDGQLTVEPVSLGATVEAGIERVAAETTADAALTDVTLPSDVAVYANAELTVVVEILLRHGVDVVDEPAEIAVAVRPAGHVVRTVITVPDGGTLHEKLQVLAHERETQLDHLDGVDLWVAKWLVTEFGGSLTSREVVDGGSQVCVELARAESAVDSLRYAWLSMGR